MPLGRFAYAAALGVGAPSYSHVSMQGIQCVILPSPRPQYLVQKTDKLPLPVVAVLKLSSKVHFLITSHIVVHCSPAMLRFEGGWQGQGREAVGGKGNGCAISSPTAKPPLPLVSIQKEAGWSEDGYCMMIVIAMEIAGSHTLQFTSGTLVRCKNVSLSNFAFIFVWWLLSVLGPMFCLCLVCIEGL